MSQREILKKVLEVLNKNNIPCLITGGIAVNYYGKPRFTHDVDILIQIENTDVENFLNLFKEEFYISKETIQEAIFYKTTFNIIHMEEIVKIDFWILKDEEFDRNYFLRRVKVNILDVDTYLPTPEDLILNKLKWFKETQIQKHFFDAESIYRIQEEKLDRNYLESWAKKLNIFDELIDI